MNDQSFLFNRAYQSINTWKDFEEGVFKALKASFNFKAETIAQFKRLANTNRKQFVRDVEELFDKHQIIFNEALSFHTRRVIADTLTVTDRLVRDIEDKAKTWIAPEVKPNGVVVDKNGKRIANTDKAINADLAVARKSTLVLLNNRYSFISKSIATNVSKLDSSELSFSEIRKAIRSELAIQSKNGVPTIATKGGRQLDLVNYMETSVRANYKNLFIDTQTDRYNEYDIDLIITDVLFDSSAICEPWQGGIYDFNNSGKTQYTNLVVAQEEGHMTHINCRHIMFPYIHNVTTKPESPNKEVVAKNRRARQTQRYNERQIRQWKRRNAVNPTDDNKAKVSEWQARQRQHMNSNPQIARQYEREQI